MWCGLPMPSWSCAACTRSTVSSPFSPVRASGLRAARASCLLVLQYDVPPFVGNSFGPITFMICVLGGLGNMIGGFVAGLIMSQIISVGGYYFSIEFSSVRAFLLFVVMIFVRPQG